MNSYVLGKPDDHMGIIFTNVTISTTAGDQGVIDHLRLSANGEEPI